MSNKQDQLARAFATVLNERVPDLSAIPEHVFSTRFETRMNKLLAKEAAHPWAVSHTRARNLLIAAIVLLLMAAMCMSVSGLRDPIIKFIIERFSDHDVIVFEDSQKDIIEVEYQLTTLPDGFRLIDKASYEAYILTQYSRSETEWIKLEQLVPKNQNNVIALDNEGTVSDILTIDGTPVYYNINKRGDIITLLWMHDEYKFWLEIGMEGITLDDAIELYRSIRPVPDT